MGNTQGRAAPAEATAATTKLAITRLADEYLSFIESTTVEIDEDIEDLANEIAVMCAGYRESEEVRALDKSDYDRLVGNVEQYANKQKHSIRRLLTSLRESQEVFDEIASAIAIDSDDEDEDDDNEDGVEAIASEDDEDIDDNEAFGEDEDDEDYRTVDAVADEGADEGDDEDEDDLDLDELEEMLTDEECLHAARFEATGICATYEKEMNDIDLPLDTLNNRLVSLRRMMFHSADVIVDVAVDRFVQSYFAAAMTDIHVRLMETIDDADLAEADTETIATAMSEIITVGVVARQALYDLPFVRRDAIENTCDNIEGEVKDIIRHVQMVNSHRPAIADALNDLDINGFYNSDDEDSSEDDVEEEEEEEEEEEPSPPPSKSKSASKKSSGKKGKSSAAASPAAASSSSSSSATKSKSKRKQVEVVEPEPEARRTTRRKK